MADPVVPTSQRAAPVWVPPIEAPLVRRLRPAVARRILLVAVTLGLVIQALFLGELLGINVPITIAATLGAGALLSPRPWRMDRADRWLPVAALGFAALIAIRSNPALVAFDLVAAIALTAASLASMAGAHVTRRSMTGIASLIGQGLALGGGGAYRLASAPRGLRGAGTAVGSTGRAVLVGAGIALPLLIVFGVLFASADAVFGRLLASALDLHLDVGDVPFRLLVAAGTAWVLGGLLVMVVAATQRVRRAPRGLDLRLGVVEATVALIAIDLLFGAFVAIQAGYLFGGLDTAAATGLGYAQYARRGFFELVAVAALAGMVVLGMESLVRDRRLTYRLAALALIGLTGVVLLSAGVRMALYQDAFGWSELRFFVVAAIAWLALCLVAAAGCIALGRSHALPAAVAILGLGVAFGVNVADPGAFIAEQNVRRAIDPGSVPPGGTTGLDTGYLAGLGADAVPTLVRALPTLPPSDRTALSWALAEQRATLVAEAEATGWASWNRARVAALDALTDPDRP
jgi:hypothetical protein